MLAGVGPERLAQAARGGIEALAHQRQNLVGAVTLVGLCLALAATAYTVDQTEQVVITQFGRPVGRAINADDPGSGTGSGGGAGLHFKLPVIQEAHRFEKRSPGSAVPIARPKRWTTATLSAGTV